MSAHHDLSFKPIEPAQVDEARAAAARQRRRLVDVLEEALALEPDIFTGQIGRAHV